MFTPLVNIVFACIGNVVMHMSGSTGVKVLIVADNAEALGHENDFAPGDVELAERLAHEALGFAIRVRIRRIPLRKNTQRQKWHFREASMEETHQAGTDRMG